MRFRLKDGYSVPLLFIQRTVAEDRPRKRRRRFVGFFRGTAVLVINVLQRVSDLLHKLLDLFEDSYLVQVEEAPEPALQARYFAVDVDPVTVTLRVKEIDGEVPSAQCFEMISVDGERGQVVGEREVQESPVPRVAQARALKARMSGPGEPSGEDVFYFDGSFSEMLRKEPGSEAGPSGGEDQ